LEDIDDTNLSCNAREREREREKDRASERERERERERVREAVLEQDYSWNVFRSRWPGRVEKVFVSDFA
jgi:hypothetical protein